jgi:hypothetical protein
MPFYHPSYYKKLKKLSSASEAQATGFESRETGEYRLKVVKESSSERKRTQYYADRRKTTQANVHKRKRTLTNNL